MKTIKTSLFASFCAVLVLAAALLSGCENVGGRQNNLFSIDEKSEPRKVTDNSGLPDGQENSSDEDGDKPHESVSDVMHESDIENTVVVSEEKCRYGSSEIISKTEYVYNQDGNKIQTIVYSVGSNGGLYLSSHQNTYYFDGEFSNVVKRTEKYTPRTNSICWYR